MTHVRPGFERQHHSAGKHEEAKCAYRRRMQALTPEERLRQAWELTRRVYGESLTCEQPMDRSAFAMRKHPQ